MASIQHRRPHPLCIGLVVFSLVAACGGSVSDSSESEQQPTLTLPSVTSQLDSTTSISTTTTTTTTPPSTEPEIQSLATGAQVLVDSQFGLLRGKRVGLIANHTSVANQPPDGVQHLADLMFQSPEVDLVALFAPEHGLRGDVLAGETVLDATDPATGLPVFSLYGETRQPTSENLADLDVLVYDIQDVGARFYTFISTMGLAMQSAAQAGLDFVVLDRPNPLGGETVGGFLTTPELTSFVSQYPIPSVYGLTAGELANAIKGESWLTGLDSLNLTVVPVAGWRRDMIWSDWSTIWTPPSPALTTFDSALAYPGVVVFEATTLNYGRGTDSPFLRIVGPEFDGELLATDLNSRGLPGVMFSAEPNGIRYQITDPKIFRPLETGIHVLETFFNSANTPIIDRPEVFDRLAGSPELRTMLEAGANASEIIARWQTDVANFETIRQKYLLY